LLYCSGLTVWGLGVDFAAFAVDFFADFAVVFLVVVFLVDFATGFFVAVFFVAFLFAVRLTEAAFDPFSDCFLLVAIFFIC